MKLYRHLRSLPLVMLAMAAVSAHAQFPPATYSRFDAPLSAYLVGAGRATAVTTIIQVVNPTPVPFWLYVATFRADGSFYSSVNTGISSNGLVTLVVDRDVKAPSGEPFVVKVISVRRRGDRYPVQGIVGYLTQAFRSDETKSEWSERVPLAAVPTAVLQAAKGKELGLIMQQQ